MDFFRMESPTMFQVVFLVLTLGITKLAKNDRQQFLVRICSMNSQTWSSTRCKRAEVAFEQDVLLELIGSVVSSAGFRSLENKVTFFALVVTLQKAFPNDWNHDTLLLDW